MATRNLTEGPVWRALAAVSAPLVLGIFGVLSVGVADAYFLGQLGSAPLAAVGFVYPVTAAITSLSIGLSAGANAALSQAIGREEKETAVSRLAFHAIGLGVVLALAVAVLFWALAGPLFELMGAGPDAFREIRAYVPFWAMSFPFLVLMMQINAVFRAHGHGGITAAIMIAAAVVNIGLDPVLIYGLGPVPEMGTGGAALATLIGRGIAAAIAVVYALNRGYLQICSKPLGDLAHSLKQILSVGLPAAFANAINPAGMAAVTAAVATLGETAVAGFGAATRVQSLAVVPLLALSAGIGPVVGQNWGAEKPERGRLALRLCWGLSALYGLTIALTLTLLADPIARLLTSGEETVRLTADYLRYVSWSFAGFGLLVTTNAAINARSKALWSMGLSLARILAVYVPAAWIGAALLGYPGILGAAILANAFAVVGAGYAAWRTDLWDGRLHLGPVTDAAEGQLARQG